MFKWIPRKKSIGTSMVACVASVDSTNSRGNAGYLNGSFTFSHSENAILQVLGEAEKADFNAKMLTLKKKNNLKG